MDWRAARAGSDPSPTPEGLWLDIDRDSCPKPQDGSGPQASDLIFSAPGRSRTRNLMGRNHLLYPVELQGRGTYEQELYLHMLTCGYACKHIPVARQSYRGHTTVGQNVRLVAIVLALPIETRLAHIGYGTALIRFRSCCYRTRATPGTQG